MAEYDYKRPGVTDTDSAAWRAMQRNEDDNSKRAKRNETAARKAKQGRRPTGSSAFEERISRALEGKPSAQRDRRKVLTDPTMKKGQASPATFGFLKTAPATEAKASDVKTASSPTPKSVRARSGGTGMEGSPETKKVTPKGKPKNDPPPKGKNKPPPSKPSSVSKDKGPTPMPRKRKKAPATDSGAGMGEGGPSVQKKGSVDSKPTRSGIFDRLDKALGGKGKADYTYDMPGNDYAKGGMVKRMKGKSAANGKAAKLKAAPTKRKARTSMACGGSVKKKK